MSAAEDVHADPTPERFRALLEVSEAIASHRDLPGLFHELAQRLPRVVAFDFLALVLHDPARNVMRLHILESRVPTTIHAGKEAPVDESVGGLVWQTQQPFVVANTDEETRFPAVLQLLREHSVKSLCVLPLTTALRRVGAMGVGSLRPGVYSKTDAEFLRWWRDKWP